jgi:hypothetical protein
MTEKQRNASLSEPLTAYFNRHIPLRPGLKSEIDARVRDQTERLAGKARVTPKDYAAMNWAVRLKLALTFPWNIFVYLLLAAIVVMLLI